MGHDLLAPDINNLVTNLEKISRDMDSFAVYGDICPFCSWRRGLKGGKNGLGFLPVLLAEHAHFRDDAPAMESSLACLYWINTVIEVPLCCAWALMS